VPIDDHAGAEVPDGFEGRCAMCGAHHRFVKDERPTRESYVCPSCGWSLRYQGQARVIIQHYSRRGAVSVTELAQEREFRSLRIWEPGVKGPFPRYLAKLPHYQRSGYWADAEPGEIRDGVRCEDLMATTFSDDTFDLVITSDIFEHVRKPSLGFHEMYRVLRPGGAHVFSIPVTAPMRPTTVERVDTSGDEDVFVLEPRYHKEHLVYNEFGQDVLELLEAAGFQTALVPFETTNPNAARLLTFCSVKPATPSNQSKSSRRSWFRRRRATDQ